MSTKEAVGFEQEELLELEMILVDEDAQAALEFLKRAVWNKIQRARRGRLKCHLDYSAEDTVNEYQRKTKAEDS